MSRYGDNDYEESFNNESEFWRANMRRAMKGKRGRQALRDLREALHALPERRLIANACSTYGAEPIPTDGPVQKFGDPDFDWEKYWPQRVATEHNELLAEQGQGVCSVAAYVWHQRVKAGADPQQALIDLPLHPDYDGENYATPEMGIEAGLTKYVAWELMYRNDETYSGMTPEDRWTAVVAWIDAELAEAASETTRQ